LCALLAAVMLAGLGVGAVAVEVELPDTSTWPNLVLDQPVTLEFIGYFEAGLFDPPTETYPTYEGRYRFTPAESGSYFFEILGPKTFSPIVAVVTKDFTSVWDNDIIPVAGKVAQLEGGAEYLLLAHVLNMTEATGTFQVVARKVNMPWWQSLPPFLQFLLRWLAFGWIWMR